MLPLPVLPQNTWYRTLKKSVFVLVLILFFCSSLVAATGLQVQTQAPVNKTVATAETTPVKLGTTTAVPVQTAVKTTASVPVQTAVKTATTVLVFATATKTTTPVPVPTSAKGPLTFGTVSPTLLPGKDPDITDCPANFSDLHERDGRMQRAVH